MPRKLSRQKEEKTKTNKQEQKGEESSPSSPTGGRARSTLRIVDGGNSSTVVTDDCGARSALYIDMKHLLVLC